MVYSQFVVNQVPIIMSILANLVANHPVPVETGARHTFHVNIFLLYLHTSPLGIGTSCPRVSYLESPYLSTDVNALVHASLLSDSVVEQTDMATDEQANSLTNAGVDRCAS